MRRPRVAVKLAAAVAVVMVEEVKVVAVAAMRVAVDKEEVASAKEKAAAE